MTAPFMLLESKLRRSKTMHSFACLIPAPIRPHFNLFFFNCADFARKSMTSIIRTPYIAAS